MTIPAIHVRRVTEADTATIVYHRQSMFRDMGMPTPAHRADQINAAYQRWLTRMLAAGDYVGFFAVTTDEHGAEQVAAGAGLLIYDWIPNLLDGNETRGYIMNVYTEAAFRKRGLARQLVELCVEHCRGLGIQLIMLHASEAGRPIYEQLGFKPTNEMRLMLDK